MKLDITKKKLRKNILRKKRVKFDVLKVRCSNGSMFRRFDVPTVQCSDGSMFRQVSKQRP